MKADETWNSIRGRLSNALELASQRIFPDSSTHDNPGFSNDVVSLITSSPDHSPLQLLDTPGRIATAGSQRPQDPQIIDDMLSALIRNPHAIILPVVSAGQDVENEACLGFCAKYDKTYTRTLAVLTKPDLDEAKLRAKTWIEIINGENPDFKSHGWHVVRLFGPTDTRFNKKSEAAFFKDSPEWNDVKDEDRGIEGLRLRIADLLFNLAQTEFPKLRQKLFNDIAKLRQDLVALGVTKEIPDDRKLIVFEQALRRLRDRTRDSLRAEALSELTDHDTESPGYLRSRAVEDSKFFRDLIMVCGHTWETFALPQPPNANKDLETHHNITLPSIRSKLSLLPYKDRDHEIEEMKKIVKNLPGRETPGNFNPDLVNLIFRKMSPNWIPFGQHHIENIHRRCKEFFKLMTPIELGPTNDVDRDVDGFWNSEDISQEFMKEYLEPTMEDLKTKAGNELRRLDTDGKNFIINFDYDYRVQTRAKEEERAMYRYLKTIRIKDENSQANSLLGREIHAPNEKTPMKIAIDAGLHFNDEILEEAAIRLLVQAVVHYNVSIFISYL